MPDVPREWAMPDEGPRCSPEQKAQTLTLYPLSRGEATAARGPGRTQVSQPRVRAHIVPTHSEHGIGAEAQLPFPPPPLPFVHPRTRPGPATPRSSLTPTLRPHTTAHLSPCRAVPSHVAPSPLPSAPTPPSPSRPLGTLQPGSLGPPHGQPTPPCSPQTFLSLLLSLWREQRSLPPGGRMAEPWRQPPPPPPTQSQEGRFGSGAREPGQPAHPSARAPRRGGICRKQGGLAHGQ